MAPTYQYALSCISQNDMIPGSQILMSMISDPQSSLCVGAQAFTHS